MGDGGRLLLTLLLPSVVGGKRVVAGLVEGYQQDWKFVNKFAFAKTTADDPGTISMRAWTFMPDQKLLVYQNDNWFDAYDSTSMSCSSRAGLASRNLTIPRGRFYGEAGGVLREEVVQEEPAFWFLAISRCLDLTATYSMTRDSCIGISPSTLGDAPNGVFMYYEVTMLNPGGYWLAQFSADEQGLLEMNIVFTCAYIILCASCGTALLRHMSSRRTDESVSLYALLISIISLSQHFLMTLHLHNYATDGIGLEWALHVSEAAAYVAEVMLTLLVLLLGKGWMVSRRWYLSIACRAALHGACARGGRMHARAGRMRGACTCGGPFSSCAGRSSRGPSYYREPLSLPSV